LFQETGKSAAADENINLVLQGVVVSFPSQFSSAVIKVNDVVDRYRVGESIDTTSYQLAEVYWDRVVLRQNNGSTRELPFKRMENGLDQPIVQPVVNAPSSNHQSIQAVPSQESSALGQAVQKIQEDREQYLKDMGVNAASGGYEVTSRTPAALRSKLGLQPGDRIMSLNGQAVGQGQSDAQLLEQARREGQVKLEIKRGDQVMTIQQNF
jgi:general secretion pathway protein C